MNFSKNIPLFIGGGFGALGLLFLLSILLGGGQKAFDFKVLNPQEAHFVTTQNQYEFVVQTGNIDQLLVNNQSVPLNHEKQVIKYNLTNGDNIVVFEAIKNGLSSRYTYTIEKVSLKEYQAREKSKQGYINRVIEVNKQFQEDQKQSYQKQQAMMPIALSCAQKKFKVITERLLLDVSFPPEDLTQVVEASAINNQFVVRGNYFYSQNGSNPALGAYNCAVVVGEDDSCITQCESIEKRTPFGI